MKALFKNHKKLYIFIVLILFFLSIHRVWGNVWWDFDWYHRINFTVNNTVSKSDEKLYYFPLVDYPVNVTLNGSYLRTKGMQFNGDDFRILDNQTELVWYNFTNFSRDDANIMFVINLTEGQNKTVQIYLNNSNAILKQYNLSQIFSIYETFNNTANISNGNNPNWYHIGGGYWTIGNGQIGIIDKAGDSINKNSFFCKKNLNLSTGFILEYHQWSTTGTTKESKIYTYFNETGTASETTNNRSLAFYEVRTAGSEEIRFGNLTNYTSGSIEVYGSWAVQITLDPYYNTFQQNFSPTKRLELTKWNLTNYDLNFSINYMNKSVISAGVNKTYVVMDRNVQAIAGTVCFGNDEPDAGATNMNYTNITLYQKVNPDVAEDLAYSLSTITETADNSLTLSECGAGTKILNYTLYDEKTKELANETNSTLDLDMSLVHNDVSNLKARLNITKNANNLTICSVNINTSKFRLDSIMRYNYLAHAIEYHYFDNYSLLNQILPIQVPLYDLRTSESTSFLVKFQDENYLTVQDAIINVLRYYVGEGLFRSVEHGKTDSSGQTAVHLVQEDIIYKFRVSKNNYTLYESPELKALCLETPCQINLLARNISDITTPIQTQIIYNYSQNETSRNVAFTYRTVDGSSTTINLTAWVNNGLYNESVCSSVLTASSGTVSCEIPATFGNRSYMIQIYNNNQLIGWQTFNIKPKTSREYFGDTGFILAFMSFLTLALMGMSSGVAVIIFGVIGLIFISLINIFEGGNIIGFGSAMLWIIIAGAILIWKMTTKRSH